jgi:hypothetical protein
MRDLNANRPGTVCALLLFWQLFTSGCILLHAQGAPEPPLEAADVPASSVPSSDAATPSRTSLTFAEQLKIYGRSFLGPQFWIGPALGTAVSGWTDTPQAWTRGPDGFGRRVASNYGRSAIGDTIGFGIAALDHENTRFAPSHEHGFWRRTLHAVTDTFVSRDDDGDTMPAFSRVAGAYGAGFIADAWVPKSQDNTGYALERGSTALLSSVGWNVLDEFWPDIRKAFHRSGN